MARSHIGLDIGTGSVRAAELRSTEPATLSRFGQLALPSGAMSNGEIVDQDAIASVIKDLWRRGGFKSKEVHIAVANQSVVVRQVDVPRMSEEDLHGALGFQVQDYIPIPLEDAILDHVPLEEFIAEDGTEMMRVLAIAAQREMIEAFVQVVAQAGLQAVGVDISALAAVRALSDNIPPVIGEIKAEAIVDIGAGVTNVVVHEHGTPRFVRIVASGGNDITGALVAALQIPPDEAEIMKISTGLQPEAGPMPSGAEGIIEQRGRQFIDDLRKSIDFYQSQPDAAPISRVSLVGGGSQLLRLRERLGAAIHLPVEFGDALSRLIVGEADLSDEQLEQVASVGAVAIGLAMEI